MQQVFPARAGMNRAAAHLPAEPDRVPRASGDEPPFQDAREELRECSLRERG